MNIEKKGLKGKECVKKIVRFLESYILRKVK